MGTQNMHFFLAIILVGSHQVTASDDDMERQMLGVYAMHRGNEGRCMEEERSKCAFCTPRRVIQEPKAHWSLVLAMLLVAIITGGACCIASVKCQSHSLSANEILQNHELSNIVILD